MAFFEQLGKKIADAGQGVAQQTKNFTDVAKLNSTISEKEKKINQLYTAIGQAIYAAHKDDADFEAAQSIGEINTLLDEIAQCREKINEIKGITKCPGCGADVPRGSAFCSSCGTAIPHVEPEPAASSARVCPGCGAEVSEDSLFCNSCGRKLDAPAEASSENTTQE